MRALRTKTNKQKNIRKLQKIFEPSDRNNSRAYIDPSIYISRGAHGPTQATSGVQTDRGRYCRKVRWAREFNLSLRAIWFGSRNSSRLWLFYSGTYSAHLCIIHRRAFARVYTIRIYMQRERVWLDIEAQVCRVSLYFALHSMRLGASTQNPSKKLHEIGAPVRSALAFFFICAAASFCAFDCVCVFFIFIYTRMSARDEVVCTSALARWLSRRL